MSSVHKWMTVALLGALAIPSAWAVRGTVTNTEGRSFEGDMRVDRTGTLHLEVEADQGSVSYTLKKENLGGIEFEDAEAVEEGLYAFQASQFQTTIEYLEPVHRQRSPFFKLLPINALAEPSIALGKAYLEVGRFTDATGVAGVLLGNGFSDPTLVEEASEMRLRSFFGLERWDETEVLAKRWCETKSPYHESALGWWILAEVYLAREEFEKARWTSLQPITFSSQYPKSYLQECYHVAIASWIRDSSEQALKLYREYKERGFKWPAERLPTVYQELTTLELSEMEETQSDEAPLEIEEGAPEKDLNLPLETVRKLTSQPDLGSSP